jgi:cell volume regulation protein A
MVSVPLVFMIATVIILIGAVGDFLFRRTGVPDMLFLLALGLIVGPLLGIIRTENIEPLTPFLSTLAVVIILFDGGLGLNLQKAVSQAPRAIVLAILGFVMSVAAVTFVVRTLLHWSLLQGALFGTMVGGSSSVVVIALVQRLGLRDDCKTTLVLESSITDILCIVGAISILQIMTAGLPPIQALASQITSKFTTGIVLGGVVGFLWLGILPKLYDEPYKYMVTLASIFLIYFLSEAIGGSGAISALVFGLVLANSESILSVLKRAGINVADESFRRLDEEIVFLVKAFFFVYLGLIVIFPSLTLVLLTLGISLALLGVRYFAVVVSSVRSNLARERGAMSAIYGRGLAAAVLAIMPEQFGLPNASTYTSLTLLIIVFTAVLSSVGAAMIKRGQKGHESLPEGARESTSHYS